MKKRKRDVEVLINVPASFGTKNNKIENASVVNSGPPPTIKVVNFDKNARIRSTLIGIDNDLGDIQEIVASRILVRREVLLVLESINQI